MTISPIAVDRSQMATEYLYALRSLAAELERAMESIARNRLIDLEESLTNQQTLSARLKALTEQLSIPLEHDSLACQLPVHDTLRAQISAASKTLQMLNQRYAALLKHSSRSLTLMLSLFSSFQGQLQEGTGSRLKHQTWSCQV